jgi:hypothetical protein
MNVSQFEEVTLGTTSEVTITVINAGTTKRAVNHYVKVISGSVKFGKDAVPTNATAFTSADVVPPIKCVPGELKAKGGASDKILVTIAD